MTSCGVSSDWGDGSSIRLLRVLLAAWWLSVLHRLGVLILGLRMFPWRIEVPLPQGVGMATLPLPGEIRHWVWVLLIVLLGVCGSTKRARFSFGLQWRLATWKGWRGL